MESIKIEKDGSMSIPAPGKMKITVEMTEGLFEEFMQFRKSKAEYDNRASKEIDGLRRRMTYLAQAVIKSKRLLFLTICLECSSIHLCSRK